MVGYDNKEESECIMPQDDLNWESLLICLNVQVVCLDKPWLEETRTRQVLRT